MANIWANSSVAFLIAALASAGVAAIIFGIYYFWTTKTGARRKLKDSEGIIVVSFAFFISFGLIILLVNQLAEDSRAAYRANQQFNCWHSLTTDGKEFTESQCDYFQDVLNGKYIDKKAVEDIEDSKHIDD